VCAYATNDEGTSFGDVKTFFTIQTPVVITNVVNASSYSLATLSGSIVTRGSTLLESGFCYDTFPNPSISKSKISMGLNTNIATTFTTLNNQKLFYYKAFATFGFGTVYGAEQTFTLGPKIFTDFGTVSDYDGNVYKTIKLGNKTWMTENLKTTHYRDGTPIPYQYSQPFISSSQGAYAYYADASTNFLKYGALYNYYAVSNSSGLAPTGWHVATHSEWQELLLFVITANPGVSAFSQLAANNSGAVWSNSYYCNINNFSSLSLSPGGFRSSSIVTDDLQGLRGHYWSSTLYSTSYPIYYAFSPCTYVYQNDFTMNFGLSVRCVKD
jgi:uncharacterized protein (TIGR02145 family)